MRNIGCVVVVGRGLETKVVLVSINDYIPVWNPTCCCQWEGQQISDWCCQVEFNWLRLVSDIFWSWAQTLSVMIIGWGWMGSLWIRTIHHCQTKIPIIIRIRSSSRQKTARLAYYFSILKSTYSSRHVGAQLWGWTQLSDILLSFKAVKRKVGLFFCLIPAQIR